MAVTCLSAPALSTNVPNSPPPHPPAGALPIFPQGVEQSVYTLLNIYVAYRLLLWAVITYQYMYIYIHIYIYIYCRKDLSTY